MNRHAKKKADDPEKKADSEKKGDGEKTGEVQYREDWGVWDDMDITDDENDKVLLQSSEDNTATDDSDEDKKYLAQKEIEMLSADTFTILSYFYHICI